MEQAPYFVCALGHAYALKGDAPRAKELLKQVLWQRDQGDFVNATGIAEVYAGLGDRERTLEWLERAYQERDEALLTGVIDPKFDRYREDPRFQDLILRLRSGAKSARGSTRSSALRIFPSL